MSYDLYIWDPARHAPMPEDADQAYDTKERLGELKDGWNSTLTEFAGALVDAFETDAPLQAKTIDQLWGIDPRKAVADRQFAALRLALPGTRCTTQVACAVAAAARLGLVVFDDDVGACFLPDGRIFPEDMRAIWAADLAEMQADIADPHRTRPDGRNLLQKIAGELFDALGRGEKSR